MTPPSGSTLVEIGPFAIHWYGLLIVTGIVLGAQVAGYLAKRADEDPDRIWDMLLFAVVLGVIGARIYHVVSQPRGGLLGWAYYKENPIEMFYIWKGGLGIFGAVIGGALGVALYCRLEHLRVLKWLDFAAPGMAIGQAIGRWGNYMNRELYGPPTTRPWGLQIPQQHRFPPYHDMSQYPPETLFHPTFLYESLAALLLCLGLLWIATRYRKKLKEGDLLLGYLMGYAVIRFFTEMLRPDAWMITGTPLAAAQLVAILFFILAGIVLFFRHRPGNVASDAA
ncbi:MAG: prolipoprotein diacylglyceryl transferase [Anaerolineales bacterium]